MQTTNQTTIQTLSVTFPTDRYLTHEQEIFALLNDAFKQKVITRYIDPIQSVKAKIAEQDKLISAVNFGIEQRQSFFNQVISTLFTSPRTYESIDEDEMAIQYQATRDVLSEELEALKRNVTNRIEIHYHTQNHVKATILQTKLQEFQANQQNPIVNTSTEETSTRHVRFSS